MEKYYSECGFTCQKISTDEINSFIDEKYPIVGVVKNSSDNNTAHEVFIVGYTDENKIIVVNPSKGEYQEYSLDKFYSNGCYVLTKYKK